MLARPHCALLAFWIGVAWLFCPWAASANGRFPRAQRLVENPRDPNHLVLAATYGLLTTRDRGRSWYHICEASFSRLEMYIGDPLFDFASDLAMLVDVQAGLNRSTDDGCSWTAAVGQNGNNEEVVDFTVARQEPGRILALKSAPEEGSIVVRVLESTDDARTFLPMGAPLPVVTAFTVEIAPSVPARIYATGLTRSSQGYLLVSSDRGGTWESKSIPGTSFDDIPYLAAVHPRDARKIFVRIDGRVFSDSDGRYHAHDAVLYTDDGGDTWTEIHRVEGKAFGFALSPDGSEVLLGYGSDSGDGAFVVDEAALGIYASSTDRFDFMRLLEGSITCLSWTEKGIYVCTSQSKAGRELAFGARSSLGSNGADLQTLLRLPEVRGPLNCCDAKLSAVCKAAWPSACLILGACSDASPNDECTSDGGHGPSTDAAADGTAPTTDSGTATAATDACNCRTSRWSKNGDAHLWLLGVFGTWALARARSKRVARSSGTLKEDRASRRVTTKPMAPRPSLYPRWPRVRPSIHT